jgi:hypothetical protein
MPAKVKVADEARRASLRTIQKTDKDLQQIVLKGARSVDKVVSEIPGPGVGSTTRAAMYQSRQNELYQIMNDMWGKEIGPSVARGIQETSAQAAMANQQLLAVLLRSAPQAASAMMDSFMLSARRTFEAVRLRYMDSVPLSQMVYQNAALSSGKVDQAINNAILLGKSAKELADDVQQYIYPSTPGGARYAAMRLGRTELNRSFHSVNKESYKNSPWVEAVLWNLSGSHPTEDDCDEFADQEFSKFEVPDQPHPNCLCYTTAVTPDRQEFMNNLTRGEYDCLGE